MAFSSFNCFVPSADSSSLNVQNDACSSSPARGPLPAPTSSLHAFTSNHDQLSVPLTSRSSKGMVVCGVAIAATTAISLSLCSLDCVAIAAEFKMNNTAVLSVASVHSSPDFKPASGQNPSSTSSNTNPDLSFSMAIPIPHEEAWVRVLNGFIAPLPHTHEHGLVMPFSQTRKTAVAPAGSTLKCPQWTPSELEMVLPDFHGRPKPFPQQGHHWSASFVMKGETFPQPSDSSGEVEVDGLDGRTTIAMDDNIDKQKREGKLSLLRVLGMEKFTCFSM